MKITKWMYTVVGGLSFVVSFPHSHQRNGQSVFFSYFCFFLFSQMIETPIA